MNAPAHNAKANPVKLPLILSILGRTALGVAVACDCARHARGSLRERLAPLLDWLANRAAARRTDALSLPNIERLIEMAAARVEARGCGMTEEEAQAMAETLLRRHPDIQRAAAEARDAGMSWGEIAHRVARAVERIKREVD